MQKQLKIIIEKHADGYTAYPLGITGVVVGEGDTYNEALADVKSAIHFISKPLDSKFWKSLDDFIKAYLENQSKLLRSQNNRDS